ncbi:hypothetical protein DL96DRAFT_1737708 [Flagelloscypha sp. PMI_526]|nr:hypothetical protein DL96DRAFT_1737708 [Flagelloscypha sp. PMI_526]
MGFELRGREQVVVENITTPTEFLTKIGRESETKYEAPETWRQFWRFTDGLKLRKDGLAVKDRRYILWCMERFRLGHAVVDFAHKPKPPKTIRGWGPIVQKGRRIRSKRRKQAPSDEKRRP